MWCSPLLKFLREDQTSVCTHDFSIFPSTSDGGWLHEIPSLLTHLSFLPSSKWEIFISVIIPEPQKYSLSNTNTSEAYEFYYIAVVRLLVYLAQIISGKQKAESFTADNTQKWTYDDWKYRKRSKWERYCEGFKEKNGWKQSDSKEKIL